MVHGDDSNGPETFGDGSNRWIDGTIEFFNDPGQLAEDPYDTIAGAADAGALNFDEGVGGLVSLVDDEAGNTAGPGTSPWLESPNEGDYEHQPDNPGTTGVPILDKLFKGFVLVIVAIGGIYVLRLLEVIAALLGDG